MFIGAGYISLEFAHLAHQAGAKVTVLGRGTPLPSFEQALVERLLEHTRQIGIDLHLDYSVSAVEKGTGATPFHVHVGHGDHMHVVEADLVVHGAGRVPNSARLDVERGGMALEHHGTIRVNEFLQSVSNPRVYAAGDVGALPARLPLTPVPRHEGTVVAANLLGGNIVRPDFRGMASAVFTIPSLAGVGLTEKAARAKGINVRVRPATRRSGTRTGGYTSRWGCSRSIIDTATDRIVGAHLLGATSKR